MTIEDGLKPCPFCGGEPMLRDDHPDPLAARWVECRRCFVEGTTYPTSEEAIAAWNTRIEADRPTVDGLAKWALEKSSTHHRLALENKHLRAEHVASSAAYREIAEQITALAAHRSQERDHG